MITISTRDQLAEMVDKNRDLIVDDNMTIEFSTTRDEIRNVKCDNLFMLKNGEYFSLNIGGDFTGWDFTGWDFTGRNFTGRNISYYAFWCCYGWSIVESIVVLTDKPQKAIPAALWEAA